MKAIILGISSAIVAVAGLAAPAGALGLSVGGNSSMTSNGYVRMGISPEGKIIFHGETVRCFKSNYGSSGGFNFGNTTPVTVEPTTVPSATPDAECNAQQVVAAPDPVTTVTINNVCGDPAELAKITKKHSNVIINSVGPCPTESKPADTKTPAPVATVVVKEPAVVTAAAATSAPVSNPKGGGVPAEMPQTGASEYILTAVAAGLAIATYAGVLLVRTIRRA